MIVPWAMPALGAAERAAVERVLRSGWLTMGSRTREFEACVADRAGRRYAAAVCNGTAALDLALQVLGISPGDEVIVPAISYIATASTVVRCGAIPVFADIEGRCPTIAPESIEARLTRRTRLIVTMDYGGTPCAHEAIRGLARRHGIAILHDGAQSFGGQYRGRPLLSYGAIATTSFHIAKSITTVEGGMVLTSRAAWDSRVRVLRNQGESPHAKYIHTVVGCNYRLSDLHAAIGLAQIRRAHELLTKRRALANAYTELLREVPEVVLPEERPAGQNGWFFYAIRVRNRDAIASRLRDSGVETRIAYPRPLYDQPALRRWKRRPCAEAERFAREVLNLPLFATMTREQLQHVVTVLKKSLSHGCRTPQHPRTPA